MTLTPPSSHPSPGNLGESASSDGAVLRVAIFDDVVAARAEQFHIPGLAVEVFAHADDAAATCSSAEYDLVFMDFSLGAGHKAGDLATLELRAAGFRGKVIAISSDPMANDRMLAAGADDSLAKKAHLRSYLVHLGALHLGRSTP
jgi:CheY-like chemotaxis protein